jgi:hypothetical protein
VAGVEDDVFIFSGMFDVACSTVRKVFAASPDNGEPIATPVGGLQKLSLKWS